MSGGSGGDTGWRQGSLFDQDSAVSPLHTAIFGLTSIAIVALAVAVVFGGIIDHKSKHLFEARCQHHDGVVMQSTTGSKTCLPKGMGEELGKLNDQVEDGR
jgi:hypothetical protein